jgi:low affinity Fe/Cu permease
MGDLFHRFSTRVSNLAGSSWAFILAAAIIVVWAISGPFFGFSNTWQLVINTGTTIITFLMVFLIQNTQNRDSKAIHLKLDELISGLPDTRDRLIDIEEASDKDLDRLEREFREVRERLDLEPSNGGRAQDDGARSPR